MFRRLNPIGCPQVEHEQLFPGRQTYARYLHVAEAVAEDTAQAPWDGLGGRLKALHRGQAKAQADVADVSAKLEAGLAEVKADMVDMKAEVKADMADMKALLEQLVARR